MAEGAAMEGMREVLRGSLGRSLAAASVEDRLAAAWMVACGPAMAERGSVLGYREGVVHIETADAAWREQMTALRPGLERGLEQIARVPVRRIEFCVKGGREGQRR